LLVRFRAGTSRTRQQAVLDSVMPDGESIRRLSGRTPARQLQTAAGSFFDHVVVVKLPESANVNAALKRLQKTPDVLYAEPNYRLKIFQAESPQVIPDDFSFPQQWNLDQSPATNAAGRADIHAPEAWKLGTGVRSIKVAVIDTGIDFFHPDLAANIWTNVRELAGNGLDDDNNGYIDDVHGYDFVSDDSDPLDDNNHGTHVAGIIGAAGNNRIGVAGVCWQVSLIALKAFDENGDGDTDKIIEAIHYAVANGARIINASWGTKTRSLALGEAIQAAHNAGIVFIAAAGNENTDALTYPAAFAHVLAVAATSEENQRTHFSNYGSHISLGAPGVDILSTIPNNSYEFSSGTSMSAPHVAGVAALILARHPDFTNEQIESILRNTADPITTDQFIGSGRLNAYRALQVNAPLPVVNLALPNFLFGTTNLVGTAAGNDFAGYTLAYGNGSNPTNWIEFHVATNPVENGNLLADFYTAAINEGVYTFRLTATNLLGQTATTLAVTQVRNAYIAFPLNNDVLRAGDPIRILGSVRGHGRTFTVQHGHGWQPRAWFDDGITLANAGNGEISDSLLATWDTRLVPTNDFQTLKLTVQSAGQVVAEFFTHMIYLDGQLKTGWPQYLPVVGDYPIEDWRDLKVADVDNDGRQELILVDHGNSVGQPARLLVFNSDGSLRWSRDLASGEPYSDIPVVGDIDGDGFPEIFVDVGAKGELFGFHHDGTPLVGNWPVHLEATSLGKVLADLDGDGFKELIGYSQNTTTINGINRRQLVVIDHTGMVIRKWSLADCDAHPNTEKIFPAVGNLDENPDLEIVVRYDCSSIAAFSLRNPTRPIWVAATDGTVLASPVIGDLYHSGSNQVIVGASKDFGGYQGGLYVFDNQGRRRPGWPVLVDESFSAAPALADFDGDGTLEICIPSWSSKKIHLVHGYGFEAFGWPVGPLTRSAVKTSVVIGDVNGDGFVDVVLGSPGNLRNAISLGDTSTIGGVKAWGFDGRPISFAANANIPVLVMEGSGGSSFLKAAPIILTDLDGNGKLNVVASSVQDTAYSPGFPPAIRKNRSSLYVWELAAPFKREKMPWPTFQGNSQNTGYYEPPRHVNEPPVVGEIPDQTVKAGKDFFPIELDRYVDDPDNSTKEISWRVTGANQLRVSIGTDRVAKVFAPDPNWIGTEPLQFIARDPSGLESARAAVFTVKLDYNPPEAIADAVVTAEDASIEIDTLANDTNPAAGALRILNFSRPQFGSAELSEQGKLIFTPAPDFNGLDTLTYTVGDGKGGLAIGGVTVQVTPVNDPPVAVLDQIITLEDTPVTFDPLANDYDVESDPITLVDFGQPKNGTVTRNADQSFLYTPKHNFSGVDSFPYTITDGHAAFGTNNVTILVQPVEDPPVAQDQTFTFNKNLTQSIPFLADDPDGETLTYSIVKGPDIGTLFAYPAVATYFPTNGFTGTTTFTYVAIDGKRTSDVATVTLKILDANNVPVAVSQSLTNKVDQALPMTLSADDPDPEDLSFQIVKLPAHGTLTGGGSNFVYRPEPGFVGGDEFTFLASDGKSNSAEATVAITLTDVNTAPLAHSFTSTTLMNTPTNIILRAADGESNPLTFRVVSPTFNGQLRGPVTNLVYTPNTNFIGSDRLSFIANDGELDSDEATVYIIVASPNHPPVALDQTFAIAKNTTLQIALAVTDLDGDALVCPILKGPQNGWVSGVGANLIYTPRTDFTGTDSFTYKAWDGQAYGNKVTETINVQSAIETTPPEWESVEALPGGQLKLLLQAQPGRTISIQASTNLLDWSALTTATVEGKPFSFVDTNAVEFRRRFYRAIQF
ncbi:MAG: tandem-95 repeat protein, partial [Verrucomicrobia bacterium]|nr:tandem-95 repeat protein [Verrucomicrobiota bacterium]